MRYHLPPLKALTVFESVARLKSYSKAGEELMLTQSAVSKQIKQLEDFFRQKLFIRKGHGIYLTQAAERLLPSVQESLEKLSAITESLSPKNTSDKILNIDIVPALNTAWLIPNLDQFHQTYPEIRVNIFSGDGKVDENNSADVIFRASTSPKIFSPEYEVQDLMEEKVIPVCNRSLWKTHGSDNMATFLEKATLLVHSTRPDMWPMYLDAARLHRLKMKNPILFEHFFMLVAAAKKGLGVALVPEMLIKDEVENGELLILPFHQTFSSPYHYYMGFLKGRQKITRVKNFRNWIEGLILAS